MKVFYSITIVFCLVIQSAFAKPLPQEAREEVLKYIHKYKLINNLELVAINLLRNEKNLHLKRSEKLAYAASLESLFLKSEPIGGYEAEIKELFTKYHTQRKSKLETKDLTDRAKFAKEIIDYNRSSLENPCQENSNILNSQILKYELELEAINTRLKDRPIDEGSLIRESKKLTKISKPEVSSPSHSPFSEGVFEEKFQKVTDDIHRTSNENLERLGNELMLLPNFSEYLDEARKILPSIEKEMMVSHESPAREALSILKSGSLLSREELIRRKILPAKDRDAGMTFSHLDGLIGEQDTVFFSIRPDNPQKPRIFVRGMGVATSVTFVLDKERALQRDKSYFTPFAYGMALDRPRIEDGPEYMKEAVPLYRNFLFRGSEAYKKFLLLSIADTIRFERTDHSESINRINEVLKEIDEFPREARAFDILKDLHFDWSELSPILIHFGYDPKYLKSLTRFQIYSMQDYFAARMKPENSSDRYLSAYQGFPVEKGVAPPIFAAGHGFWELKIPREVPLDLVSEIRVKTGLPEATEIKEAILDYAAKSKRTIEEAERGNEKIYRFKQGIE
jgi:hypothetical protein